MSKHAWSDVAKDGLWKNNAALVQILGMCPTMAVTTTAANALGLGMATMLVMTLSNFVVALVRPEVGHLQIGAPSEQVRGGPAQPAGVDHLTERGYQKRTVAFIENGSWAPTAARNMAKMFENSKDIEQVGTVTIRSAMTDENKAQLDALAKELA